MVVFLGGGADHHCCGVRDRIGDWVDKAGCEASDGLGMRVSVGLNLALEIVYITAT